MFVKKPIIQILNESILNSMPTITKMPTFRVYKSMSFDTHIKELAHLQGILTLLDGEKVFLKSHPSNHVPFSSHCMVKSEQLFRHGTFSPCHTLLDLLV